MLETFFLTFLGTLDAKFYPASNPSENIKNHSISAQKNTKNFIKWLCEKDQSLPQPILSQFLCEFSIDVLKKMAERIVFVILQTYVIE